MSRTAWTLFLLFLPASLGLLRQVIWGDGLSHQFLALGFLLFCIDQARMAVVDLDHIAAVQIQVTDARLKRFYWVTVSTIVIELVGFYAASILLGWGAMVVLLSQVWFNLCAGIQLQPTAAQVIRPQGISGRSLVLAGDIIGLLLVGLWMQGIAPLGISLLLCSMAIVYGLVKYILPLKLKSP